jgi:hypothetical protein
MISEAFGPAPYFGKFSLVLRQAGRYQKFSWDKRAQMFRGIRLAWARAQALSVLQNAYDQPLPQPLAPLDATDLELATAAAFDAGGNAFDAAAGYMTLQVKCAAEVALKLGQPFSADDRKRRARLAVGISRTGGFMKFFDAHMDTVREINRLYDEIDKRVIA